MEHSFIKLKQNCIAFAHLKVCFFLFYWWIYVSFLMSLCMKILIKQSLRMKIIWDHKKLCVYVIYCNDSIEFFMYRMRMKIDVDLLACGNCLFLVVWVWFGIFWWFVWCQEFMFFFLRLKKLILMQFSFLILLK